MIVIYTDFHKYYISLRSSFKLVNFFDLIKIIRTKTDDNHFFHSPCSILPHRSVKNIGLSKYIWKKCTKLTCRNTSLQKSITHISFVYEKKAVLRLNLRAYNIDKLANKARVIFVIRGEKSKSQRGEVCRTRRKNCKKNEVCDTIAAIEHYTTLVSDMYFLNII